ncbi:hypothetical protein DFS34DRAFT_290074 [Phlyctochytrium arcticum]|nr:hypothetical protein DFS34DRAFT_290074 [Phlyctochytrium arcticum]
MQDEAPGAPRKTYANPAMNQTSPHDTPAAHHFPYNSSPVRDGPGGRRGSIRYDSAEFGLADNRGRRLSDASHQAFSSRRESLSEGDYPRPHAPLDHHPLEYSSSWNHARGDDMRGTADSSMFAPSISGEEGRDSLRRLSELDREIAALEAELAAVDDDDQESASDMDERQDDEESRNGPAGKSTENHDRLSPDAEMEEDDDGGKRRLPRRRSNTTGKEENRSLLPFYDLDSSDSSDVDFDEPAAHYNEFTLYRKLIRENRRRSWHAHRSIETKTDKGTKTVFNKDHQDTATAHESDNVPLRGDAEPGRAQLVFFARPAEVLQSEQPGNDLSESIATEKWAKAVRKIEPVLVKNIAQRFAANRARRRRLREEYRTKLKAWHEISAMLKEEERARKRRRFANGSNGNEGSAGGSSSRGGLASGPSLMGGGGGGSAGSGASTHAANNTGNDGDVDASNGLEFPPTSFIRPSRRAAAATATPFLSDAVNSEAEFQAALALLQSSELSNSDDDPTDHDPQRSAVEPPMVIDPFQKQLLAAPSYNDLVFHPKRDLDTFNARLANCWSESEKRIFKEKVHLFGKNFPAIKAFLPFKTTRQVVEYYYREKNMLNLKHSIKRAMSRAKRKAAQAKKAGKELTPADGKSYLIVNQQKQLRQLSASTQDPAGGRRGAGRGKDVTAGAGQGSGGGAKGKASLASPADGPNSESRRGSRARLRAAVVQNVVEGVTAPENVDMDVVEDEEETGDAEVGKGGPGRRRKGKDAAAVVVEPDLGTKVSGGMQRLDESQITTVMDTTTIAPEVVSTVTTLITTTTTTTTVDTVLPAGPVAVASSLVLAEEFPAAAVAADTTTSDISQEPPPTQPLPPQQQQRRRAGRRREHSLATTLLLTGEGISPGVDSPLSGMTGGDVTPHSAASSPYEHPAASSTPTQETQVTKRTISYWNNEETLAFRDALRVYGLNWELIARHVRTKSAKQAHNFFRKKQATVEEILAEDFGGRRGRRRVVPVAELGDVQHRQVEFGTAESTPPPEFGDGLRNATAAGSGAEDDDMDEGGEILMMGASLPRLYNGLVKEEDQEEYRRYMNMEYPRVPTPPPPVVRGSSAAWLLVDHPSSDLLLLRPSPIGARTEAGPPAADMMALLKNRLISAGLWNSDCESDFLQQPAFSFPVEIPPTALYSSSNIPSPITYLSRPHNPYLNIVARFALDVTTQHMNSVHPVLGGMFERRRAMLLHQQQQQQHHHHQYPHHSYQVVPAVGSVQQQQQQHHQQQQSASSMNQYTIPTPSHPPSTIPPPPLTSSASNTVSSTTPSGVTPEEAVTSTVR